MSPPVRTPIGLHLARTARVVSQAFEGAMQEAGSSVPTWQILVLIKSQQWGAQARIAEAMGITGATLTHHLTAMEAQGLVRRWREPGNRRVQIAALTAAGEELFERLREVALRHDERVRSHLTEAEVTQLADLLDGLEAAFREPAVGRL